MKRKKGLNNYFRIAFLTLVYPFGWITSICLLIAVAAKYFNPSETDFIALFGLFFPIIFVVALVSVLLLFLLRSKQAYIHLIVILIAAPTFVRYITVQSNQNEEKIKIFTFNVHGFRGFEETASKTGTHNQIIGFVNTIQADIVCIQEFRSWSGNIENDVKTFAEETGFKASHFVGYWKRGGIQSDGFLILSKYDIENKGAIPSRTKRNIGVYTDVKVSPEKIVRIASVHLISFSLQKSEIDMFGEATLLEIDTLKKHGKNLFGKLLNTFKIRATELEDLNSFLKKTDLPLLICGDFNDTPASYIYNELIKLNLHDAHLAGGKYFGATYAGNLPWLRIDYIFFSEGINAGKSRVYPISYSDHYPISFSFALQP